MRISDLNAEERLCLVGWAKLVIRADKEFSEEEAVELKKVAREMGNALFKETVALAKDKLTRLADLKEAAKVVKNSESRQLIFSVLYELALPGTIVKEEAQVLQWLSKCWQIYDPVSN